MVAAATTKDDDDDDSVAKGIAKFIKRVGKDVSAIGSAVTGVHQQPAAAGPRQSSVPTQTWPAPVPTAPVVQVPVSRMAGCLFYLPAVMHAASAAD